MVFSALEEVNLFFHLDGEIIRDGLSSYLHVLYFARFIGDDETPTTIYFSSSLSTLIARRTS